TNTGTVHVAVGDTLYLNSGGSSASSNAFIVDSGGLLQLGGNFALNTNASETGAGIFQLYSGKLTVSGTANLVANFTQSSGTVTGTGTLEATGTVVWSGGTMNGTGSTKADAALYIITNGVTLDTRTLTIAATGTATWVQGYITFANGATINNAGIF